MVDVVGLHASALAVLGLIRVRRLTCSTFADARNSQHAIELVRDIKQLAVANVVVHQERRG